MAKRVHSYSSDEITVSWDADTCFHSEVCTKNLSSVFNLKQKPWVNVNGATKEEVIKLINSCPSGALSYNLSTTDKKDIKPASSVSIRIRPDGPIVVNGTFEFTDKDGHVSQVDKNTAFCRCGGSENKPFCDGTHKKIGFKG